MLAMKQLASLEKQGGEVEKGALRLKVGGRVCIFQWEYKSREGSEGVLLHYSRGGWTPLTMVNYYS